MEALTGQISILKSGEMNYFGIVLDSKIVSDLVSKYFVVDDNKVLHDNLLKRNRPSNHDYHITIGTSDKVHMKFILKALTTPINDIIITGIGSVTEGDKIAYFFTVTSKTLKSWSDKYNIRFNDLHITIGFHIDDVHGVSKVNKNVVDFRNLEFQSMLNKKVIKKSGKPFDNGSFDDLTTSIVDDKNFLMSCGEIINCRAVTLVTV